MTTPAAFRARYRRGDVNGRTTEQWRALFEDMARLLPGWQLREATFLRRLRLLPEDNHTLDSADVSRVDDVQEKTTAVGEWLPLVVEGLPLIGPLRVVDGNHRAHAALQKGKPGLWLDVVIARERLP